MRRRGHHRGMRDTGGYRDGGWYRDGGRSRGQAPAGRPRPPGERVRTAPGPPPDGCGRPPRDAAGGGPDALRRPAPDPAAPGTAPDPAAEPPRATAPGGDHATPGPHPEPAGRDTAGTVSAPGGDRPRPDTRRPVILAVDDDPEVLRAVRRDLRAQYGDRYRVLGARSAAGALALLDALGARGHDPALFLVDQRMPGMSGTEFLARAVDRFPDARRVLLTAYAEPEAAITAINDLHLDHYLMKPWDPPTERLFPVLDGLLDAWLAEHRPDADRVVVAGQLVSPRTHAVRGFFTRNGRPFRFLDVERDPEALALLAERPGAPLPLVSFPDGTLLAAPGDAELARALHVDTPATLPHYECVIVGAGPTGLSAGVAAASEGLSTLLLDADAPGGQAASAGPAPDHPGFPGGLSATDLTGRAARQAARYGAEIRHPARAVALTRADPAKILTLADGTEVSAETVLLCTGAAYRRLEAPGARDFEGAGLRYGSAAQEAAACIGQHVFVVGGADSAGRAAVHLARYAARVTVVMRAASPAAAMSGYLVDEVRRTPNIEVRTRSEITGLKGGTALERVAVRDAAAGTVQEWPTRFVFAFIGARPHTGWLGDVLERDGRGFLLTGADLVANGGELPAEWSLERPPYPLETSVPGVFAAGDVRARSVKRVASGVGEGAMAVSLAHRYRSQG